MLAAPQVAAKVLYLPQSIKKALILNMELLHLLI